MTRRATIAIDFDVYLRNDVADVAALVRSLLNKRGRNVEVTVLDDGAPPRLHVAPATRPATSKRSKQ